MCHASKQNAMNRLGFGINPVVEFQTAPCMHRFKMLTITGCMWYGHIPSVGSVGLDMICTLTFCRRCWAGCDIHTNLLYSHVQNFETHRNCVCTSVWTSLYHASNVFLIVHISFMWCSPQSRICGWWYCLGYSWTAVVLLPYTVTCACIFHWKVTCFQLFHAVCFSEHLLTALFAITCTACVVNTWICPHTCMHHLHLDCY